MVKNNDKSTKNEEYPQKSEKIKEKRRKLTPRQQKFVRFYMIHRNATKAAELAGYSKNTASEMGYENLNKPQIREKIEAYERKEKEILEKEYNLDMDKIRKRFAMIALGDLKKYASWDKNGLNLFNSDEIKETYGLKAIKIKRRITTTKQGDEIEEETTSIHLDDRVKALTRLGENIGMFKDGKPDDNEEPNSEDAYKRLSGYFKRNKEK